MAVDGQASVTGAALRNLVEKQSWFREHSNFVTTLVGFLVTVAAWAATQPFASEPWVQSLIVLVGFAGTAAGVSVTPNGFSTSQLRKIDEEKAEIIGSTKLVVPEFAEPVKEQTASGLVDLVDEYNRVQHGEK